MRYMIKAKWFAFAKARFRQEVVLYCSLLAVFYISVICERANAWSGFQSTREQLVGVCRILSAICSTILLLRVEHRELVVEGAKYFLSFWNWLGFVTYVGIIATVFCQMCGLQSSLIQAAIGVLNVMLWANVFQYLQMTEKLSILIAMMSHMVSDIIKFIVLYSIFLFGFSGAFYVLLLGSEGYETFVDSLITVLLMLFGQITYDPFDKATGATWVVSNLLLLAYLVSVVIVLLNLFIAMMTTSYAGVWDAVEGEVLLRYAQTIVRMEGSLAIAHVLSSLKTSNRGPKGKQPSWSIEDVDVCRYFGLMMLSKPLSFRTIHEKIIASGMYFITHCYIQVFGSRGASA